MNWYYVTLSRLSLEMTAGTHLISVVFRITDETILQSVLHQIVFFFEAPFPQICNIFEKVFNSRLAIKCGSLIRVASCKNKMMVTRRFLIPVSGTWDTEPPVSPKSTRELHQMIHNLHQQLLTNKHIMRRRFE